MSVRQAQDGSARSRVGCSGMAAGSSGESIRPRSRKECAGGRMVFVEGVREDE